MLLIITGTISPMVKDSEIKVSNHEERKKQYIDSVSYYIRSGVFNRIIFCENSGYSINKVGVLIDLAKEYGVDFEYLTFKGKQEAIYEQGKGYGEGEIMKHIFENSEMIAYESEFVKITGRLIVDNIAHIVKKCKLNKVYFNIPNRTIREWYDTRIYKMPTHIFTELFLDKYQEVNDGEGRYLEVVYTDIIREKNIKILNLPKYPRIVGISGSTGLEYSYTEWKCKVKDVLSLFGYYHIKQK